MPGIAGIVRSFLRFYPGALRHWLEQQIPMIGLQAARLAAEVMTAETDGVPYAKAVESASFPLMGRAHFGLSDLLQHRVSSDSRALIRTLLQEAASGAFEEDRRLLFALARRDDLEAAAARFFLVEAVRLNLLIGTWDQPEAEASGALDATMELAQTVLEDLLSDVDAFDEDARPLHLLIAEMFVNLGAEMAEREPLLRDRLGAIIAEVIEAVEATRLVRSLDAADAAAFKPGGFPEGLGSQRIADRYPWHFPSANAVEQRRSRVRKQNSDEAEVTLGRGDRFIDVLLDEAGKLEER